MHRFLGLSVIAAGVTAWVYSWLLILRSPAGEAILKVITGPFH